MIGWTTTVLKMTLQQTSKNSSCSAMVYGNGSDALANDARMDVVRWNRVA